MTDRVLGSLAALAAVVLAPVLLGEPTSSSDAKSPEPRAESRFSH